MAAVLRFGILTVSDTCFLRTKIDTSGPRLKKEVIKAYPSAQVVVLALVPDDLEVIKLNLQTWADDGLCDIILTTGGTGFAERDVTPEATRQIIHKEAPGLAYAMISKSLEITKMAMLSRAVCGIRAKTLIVNLPGSEKGAVECFGFIKNVISHAVALLTENKELITVFHENIQKGGAEKREYVGDPVSPSKVKIDNVATRSRQSPYAMLKVSEAIDKIFRECSPTLETEMIPFEKSVNRILAEDVYAEDPVPPFRASVKDGYAVRSSDGTGIRVVREVAAAGDEIEMVCPLTDDFWLGLLEVPSEV
ncbi:hypothetical protein JTB14_004132 [Gonioctena quinquepunctata]|nr:hypothetical protein JTB14_004132 [Gonioctena quinquepunctata]